MPIGSCSQSALPTLPVKSQHPNKPAVSPDYIDPRTYTDIPMSSLTPTQSRFLRDLAIFIELVGRKLKGASSAADNNDCNALFRDAFAAMDKYRTDGEFINIDDTYWKGSKRCWRGGNKTKTSTRRRDSNLCDWVTKKEESWSPAARSLSSFSKVNWSSNSGNAVSLYIF